MQTDTTTPLQRRSTNALALVFFVLGAALVAVAVLSIFARYFLGDQMPLIVDITTSSRPELAVANGGEYATYRTVEYTVHDPSLWTSVLLGSAVAVKYTALALTCVLVGWLARRLGAGVKLFARATARAITVLGVVLMIQPVLTNLLETLGTQNAIADSGAASIPRSVGPLDYILVPDMWSGLIRWEVVAGVVFGIGLVIIGRYLRRSSTMEQDLQGLV